MYARILLSHCRLNGLRAAAARLSRAALAAFFFSSSAFAADCPVDSTGYTPETWPTDKTGGASWTVGTESGIYNVRCGITINKVNWSIGTTGLASMAAGEAYIDANAGTRVRVASCQYLDTGSRTAGQWYVYQNTLNPIQYHAYYVITGYSDAACDPVTPAPPADECEAHNFGLVSWRSETYEGGLLDAGIDVIDGKVCYGTCKASVKRAGPGINEENGTWSWSATVELTGEQCNPTTDAAAPAPNPASPEDTKPEGEYCATTENGTEVCIDNDLAKDQKNCGYYNDNYVCLDAIKADNCAVAADGTRFCGSQATPPTAPDNGTEGVKATPDDEIADSDGDGSIDIIQIFNNTTVGGSSRPVTPDGSNPTTGTPGAGSGGAGEGEGEGGSASGGADCSAPPACEGDAIQCAVLEQQWRNRCEQMPTDEELQEAFGPKEGEDGELFGSATYEAPNSFNSNGWMGGDACLADYQLNLGSMLGTVEIPFSEWCWLLEVIGVFVMIASYVSAARIVMGGI